MSYLSQAHGLLFVHVCKNAGSSIVSALKTVFPNDLAYTPPRITGIAPVDWRLDFRLIRRNDYFALSAKPGVDRLKSLEAMTNGHLSVKQFEENIDIHSLHSFAVVRNPWSWQVSLFNYARQEKSHFQHGQPQYCDFDTYIRWRCSSEVRLQSHYLESHWGGCGVRHLLRYENLAEDWQALASSTGWPLPGLPWLNRSTRNDWRAYYSDKTAELVGNAFERDCKLYGYCFDS